MTFNGITKNTDIPIWRVLATAGFFGPDHTLYEEGSEVEYEGEPNEELEPLNQAAHDKLITYLETLDALGKAAAEKAGRPWVGRPRHLDGQLALATAVQKAEMGILGARVPAEKADKIKKLNGPAEDNTAPDTGLTDVKRKRGRPVGSTKKVSLAVAA